MLPTVHCGGCPLLPCCLGVASLPCLATGNRHLTMVTSHDVHKPVLTFVKKMP